MDQRNESKLRPYSTKNRAEHSRPPSRSTNAAMSSAGSKRRGSSWSHSPRRQCGSVYGNRVRGQPDRRTGRSDRRLANLQGGGRECCRAADDHGIVHEHCDRRRSCYLPVLYRAHHHLVRSGRRSARGDDRFSRPARDPGFDGFPASFGHGSRRQRHARSFDRRVTSRRFRTRQPRRSGARSTAS